MNNKEQTKYGGQGAPQFSPAPWRMGVHYDTVIHTRTSGKEYIRCEILGEPFEDSDGFKYNPLIAEVLFGRSDEERENNARLIAAAPDLLECLEEAHELLGSLKGYYTRSLSGRIHNLIRRVKG